MLKNKRLFVLFKGFEHKLAQKQRQNNDTIKLINIPGTLFLTHN